MTAGELEPEFVWLLLFSVSVYLGLSELFAKNVSQKEIFAWSVKSIQCYKAGLQEREQSVLKLHQDCKQNKWNLSELMLIPCWKLISEKAFCVTFGKVAWLPKYYK
jgi:hypothetical protein